MSPSSERCRMTRVCGGMWEEAVEMAEHWGSYYCENPATPPGNRSRPSSDFLAPGHIGNGNNYEGPSTQLTAARITWGNFLGLSGPVLKASQWYKQHFIESIWALLYIFDEIISLGIFMKNLWTDSGLNERPPDCCLGDVFPIITTLFSRTSLQ